MNKKNWTLEEEEMVRKYYYREGSKGVQKRIPYRTLQSISNKAYRMGMRFYQKTLPGKQWTTQEIEILKQYYPIEGNDCYKRLPNRTNRAVKIRARLMDLTKNGQPVWPQEEIDILKNNFGATKEEMQKLLPNRTWEDIREKMGQRGIHKKINRSKEQLHWTPEEIAILRQYYPIEGSKCKKRLPSRSLKAIQAYAHKLGIENISRTRAWSEEENEILRKNSQLTNKALQKLLPDRTSVAIQAKKSSYRLVKKASQPWSRQEEVILRRYYPIEGIRCKKRLPNRTREAILARAGHLMVEKRIKGSWTTEELKILRQFYPIEGVNCYKHLPNRTKEAVKVRAKAQGLRRNKLSLSWSQEEIDTLKKNVGVIKKEELQKLLPNRAWKGIEEKRFKLEMRGEIISRERPSWTPEEVAILRQYYPTEGIKCKKRLHNQSKRAIQYYVHAIGLKGPPRTWSAEENEIIRKNSQLTFKALEGLLPGRTSFAIGEQKIKLGLTKKNAPPWSSEEDAILRHYYPIEGRKCKKHLPNRTYNAIAKRATYIVDSSTKLIAGWSQKEIDILEKNFELTLDALQKLLPGRTKGAIRAKRTQIKRQLKM